jgi:hypothetical protein
MGNTLGCQIPGCDPADDQLAPGGLRPEPLPSTVLGTPPKRPQWHTYGAGTPPPSAPENPGWSPGPTLEARLKTAAGPSPEAAITTAPPLAAHASPGATQRAEDRRKMRICTGPPGGRLSGLSVSHSKLYSYGDFVWVRRVLNDPFRRFSAGQ